MSKPKNFAHVYLARQQKLKEVMLEAGQNAEKQRNLRARIKKKSDRTQEKEG